mmetsp:Transcript_143214/g.457619  ORF Transcript_143214/g.457619 Transcript_143214/m.457619 type:complete len:260 (-) Transcript_143214:527-1306(-)
MCSRQRRWWPPSTCLCRTMCRSRSRRWPTCRPSRSCRCSSPRRRTCRRRTPSKCLRPPRNCSPPCTECTHWPNWHLWRSNWYPPCKPGRSRCRWSPWPRSSDRSRRRCSCSRRTAQPSPSTCQHHTRRTWMNCWPLQWSNSALSHTADRWSCSWHQPSSNRHLQRMPCNCSLQCSPPNLSICPHHKSGMWIPLLTMCLSGKPRTLCHPVGDMTSCLQRMICNLSSFLWNTCLCRTARIRLIQHSKRKCLKGMPCSSPRR